jgi:hypothetical protein
MVRMRLVCGLTLTTEWSPSPPTRLLCGARVPRGAAISRLREGKRGTCCNPWSPVLVSSPPLNLGAASVRVAPRQGFNESGTRSWFGGTRQTAFAENFMPPHLIRSRPLTCARESRGGRRSGHEPWHYLRARNQGGYWYQAAKQPASFGGASMAVRCAVSSFICIIFRG